MGDLTENFSKKEFECPHCHESHVDNQLVAALQKLRDLAKKPIKILSGYRCAFHNKQVNGEPLSLHLSGHAADIKIENMDLIAMLELAKTIPELKGIGIYDDKEGIGEEFIHVDVRRTEGRWARMRGQYMSLERGLKIYRSNIKGDRKSWQTTH